MAKQKKSSFPSKKFTIVVKLEIVHTDLSGSTKRRGFYDERYFKIIIIDDFTRMMWVAFLRKESKAFEMFMLFKNTVESESRLKIKCLRYDRGG